MSEIVAVTSNFYLVAPQSYSNKKSDSKYVGIVARHEGELSRDCLNTAGSRGGVQGLNPLFFNRRGLVILYNFIRKEKISNAINNCYQVNPLFQKFLDPALLYY